MSNENASTLLTIICTQDVAKSISYLNQEWGGGEARSFRVGTEVRFGEGRRSYSPL